MCAQVVAEVKERTLKNATLTEEKCDQQSADAAVAVEKRVDRLELCVRKSAVDERRQSASLMKKDFELPECALGRAEGRMSLRECSLPRGRSNSACAETRQVRESRRELLPEASIESRGSDEVKAEAQEDARGRDSKR